MITNTKQNWNVGSVVKVGFMTLTVTAMKGYDYYLVSSKGIQYVFTPYNGLQKCK